MGCQPVIGLGFGPGTCEEGDYHGSCLMLPTPSVHSRHGVAISWSQANAGALGRGSMGSSIGQMAGDSKSRKARAVAHPLYLPSPYTAP